MKFTFNINVDTEQNLFLLTSINLDNDNDEKYKHELFPNIKSLTEHVNQIVSLNSFDAEIKKAEQKKTILNESYRVVSKQQ